MAILRGYDNYAACIAHLSAERILAIQISEQPAAAVEIDKPGK
jgi:hypothetical protein